LLEGFLQAKTGLKGAKPLVARPRLAQGTCDLLRLYWRSWKKMIGAVALGAEMTRTAFVMVMVLRLAQALPGAMFKRDCTV
jgi:hypothetical protein